MIVIEMDLAIMFAFEFCDWVIDLGPEGGDKGGTVLATGTPEAVAKVKESYTGKFLAEVLK